MLARTGGVRTMPIVPARSLYCRAMPPPVASPQPVAPLAIRNHSATTALGRGRQAQLEALRTRRSGLRRNDFGPRDGDGRLLDTWIGRVDGLEDLPLSLIHI